MRAALAFLLVLPLLAPLGTAPAPSGPQEGTRLEFVLRSSGGAPDGSFQQVTESRLVLAYTGGAWTGTCSGTTTVTMDGTSTSEAFTRDSPLAPPQVSGRLHRGDTLDPELTSAAAEGCRHDLGPLVVAGRAHDGSKAMLATEPADASPYQDAQLRWDARTGLVQSWSFAGRGGGFEGRLASAA